MSIELTDDDVRAIGADAASRLCDAARLYQTLLVEVRRRVPTLSDQLIDSTANAIATKSWNDDGSSRLNQTAFGCAMFQIAANRCGECLEHIGRNRADGEVVRNLFSATSLMFGMLGALAAFLNGEPPAQDSALADMQVAYAELFRQNGKTPSQRAVADRSGYDRQTVRRRWENLRQGCGTKQTKPRQS
ncbi:MAG: hypothetical protein M0038_13035 [Pseudomonadota bacterium]|jgi:hypothetical protein|nr:hypothetical protein [Pseudomonadota bacterium]